MEVRFDMELTYAEVTKINLQPSETLFVTFKSNDLDEHTIDSIRQSFSQAFPNNKVAVICLSPEDSVEFTVVKEEQSGQAFVDEVNAMSTEKLFCDGEKKCEECVCDPVDTNAKA